MWRPGSRNKQGLGRILHACQGQTLGRRGHGGQGLTVACGQNVRDPLRVKPALAAGGKQVERAQGRWRGGMWEDFDPLKPPVPQPANLNPGQ